MSGEGDELVDARFEGGVGIGFRVGRPPGPGGAQARQRGVLGIRPIGIEVRIRIGAQIAAGFPDRDPAGVLGGGLRGGDQKPSDAVAHGQAACGQHRIDVIAVKKFEPVVVESGGRELPFDLAVDLLHDAQRMARILSRVRLAGRIDLEPAAMDLAG
ncbi:hypothetical protein ES707_05352 [subsurface metagenome]